MSAGEWSSDIYLTNEDNESLVMGIRYDDPDPVQGAVFDITVTTINYTEPQWLCMRECEARRLYRELKRMMEELNEEYGREDDE